MHKKNGDPAVTALAVAFFVVILAAMLGLGGLIFLLAWNLGVVNIVAAAGGSVSTINFWAAIGGSLLLGILTAPFRRSES